MNSKQNQRNQIEKERKSEGLVFNLFGGVFCMLRGRSSLSLSRDPISEKEKR